MSGYTLVGCVPLDRDLGPAFFLPVFADKDRSGRFVQGLSADGDKVTHFVRLDDEAGLIELPERLPVAEGGPPVYVFMGEDGGIAAGNLRQLEAILRENSLNSSSPGLKLQIAELIGGAADKLKARTAVIERTRSCLSNEFSERSLGRSIVIQSVWDALAKAARGRDSAAALTRYLRPIALSVDLSSKDILPDHVWSGVGELVTISREALRDSLIRELPEKIASEILVTHRPAGREQDRGDAVAGNPAPSLGSSGRAWPPPRVDVATALQRRGLFFVLFSPIGAGKTTIGRLLMARDDAITRAVSVTTRPIRAGERDDVDYYFVSDAAFDDMVAKGEFLEWARTLGHRYGTLKSEVIRVVESGRDVMLDLDWQGAQQVRQIVPDAVQVCLLPPSLEELERRLRARNTDSEEVILAQLDRAVVEISHWSEYDYVLINNDVEKCTELVHGILKAERLKASRRLFLHDFVRGLLMS